MNQTIKMTFQEYQQKNNAINQRLSQISEITSNMAFVNTANTDNPDFVQLIKEYYEKIRQSEELTKQMMLQLGIKN